MVKIAIAEVALKDAAISSLRGIVMVGVRVFSDAGDDAEIGEELFWKRLVQPFAIFEFEDLLGRCVRPERGRGRIAEIVEEDEDCCEDDGDDQEAEGGASKKISRHRAAPSCSVFCARCGEKSSALAGRRGRSSQTPRYSFAQTGWWR